MKLLLMLALLALPARVRHPCLTLADECRIKLARCDADKGDRWARCSIARGCVARYERTCGPWRT